MFACCPQLVLGFEQGSQDELDSGEDEGGARGGAAWISGPVGSGKTAAVAAVANELGLQVCVTKLISFIRGFVLLHTMHATAPWELQMLSSVFHSTPGCKLQSC